MSLSGGIIVPVTTVTQAINDSGYSVVGELKDATNYLRDLTNQFADPTTKTMIIEGREYDKTNQVVQIQIVLNNISERVQNQSASILSIFDILMKLDTKITQ